MFVRPTDRCKSIKHWSVSGTCVSTFSADLRCHTPPQSPSVGPSSEPDHIPQEVAEAKLEFIANMDSTTQIVFKMQERILEACKNTHQLSDKKGIPILHGRPVALIQRWGLQPWQMTPWVLVSYSVGWK